MFKEGDKSGSDMKLDENDIINKMIPTFWFHVPIVYGYYFKMLHKDVSNNEWLRYPDGCAFNFLKKASIEREEFGKQKYMNKLNGFKAD